MDKIFYTGSLPHDSFSTVVDPKLNPFPSHRTQKVVSKSQSKQNKQPKKQ
jgi:hypothetical protein